MAQKLEFELNELYRLWAAIAVGVHWFGRDADPVERRQVVVDLRALEQKLFSAFEAECTKCGCQSADAMAGLKES